jgi:hypothetical protein
MLGERIKRLRFLLISQGVDVSGVIGANPNRGDEAAAGRG